jgi:hypothetical protein
MTRIITIFFVGAAALAVTACDGFGRKYPPGYTDDGVKFSEGDWRFNEAITDVHLWYFGTGSSDPVIMCKKPNGISGDLRFRTWLLAPLKQWPQPPVQIAIGSTSVSALPTVAPAETRASMTVQFSGREKNRLLRGIETGDPITVSFDGKRWDIPGVPESMREAFARKCRGKS